MPQPSFNPVGASGRAVSQPFLMENLLLKTPYKLKKISHGGTPELQAAPGAPSARGPWRGPPLKIKRDLRKTINGALPKSAAAIHT